MVAKQMNPDEEIMTGSDGFMFDSWSQLLYVITVSALSSCLILAYCLTMYKVCRGHGFAFINTLIVLLILSNFGELGSAQYDHKAGYLAN